MPSQASLSLAVCRELQGTEQSSSEGLQSAWRQKVRHSGPDLVSQMTDKGSALSLASLASAVPSSVSELYAAPLECEPDQPGGFLLTLVLERASLLGLSGCTTAGAGRLSRSSWSPRPAGPGLALASAHSPGQKAGSRQASGSLALTLVPLQTPPPALPLLL